MRRLTIFWLLLGALFVVGLIVNATIALAQGHTSIAALLAAQRESQALWALDAAGGYALVLSASYYGRHARARSVGDEATNLRDSHKAQLEAMLANAEKFEVVNAGQADEIMAQQERITAQQAEITEQLARITAQQQQIGVHEANIREMSAQAMTLQVEIYTQADKIANQAGQIATQADQNAEQTARIAAQSNQIAEQAELIEAQSGQIATQLTRIARQEVRIKMLSTRKAVLRAEIETRQEAFTVGDRRLTEQAFRAMAEQVNFNARQLDTVNRMLQYHQAELHQLRIERFDAQATTAAAANTPDEPDVAVLQITSNAGAALADAESDATNPSAQPSAPAATGWQRKL